MPPDGTIDSELTALLQGSVESTREFVRASRVLGPNIISEACTLIARCQAGILRRTWLENYVRPLKIIFSALSDFKESSSEPTFCNGLSEKHWLEFGDWFAARIEYQWENSTTRASQFARIGNVLALLSLGNVFPYRIEFLPAEGRTNKPNGESKFTKKGHARKVRKPSATSPFSFSVKGAGRLYNYEKFQPLARKFLLDALPYVAVYLSRYSVDRRKIIHNSFVNLLNHLAQKKAECLYGGIFEKLASASYQTMTVDDWETLLYDWREALVADGSGRQKTTSHGIFKGISHLLAHLAINKIVPNLTLPGYKGGKRGARNIPTLANLSPSNGVEGLTTDNVWNRVKFFFAESEQSESYEFIEALCSAGLLTADAPLSIQELITGMQALNKERLVALRALAESELMSWYSHWKRGAACIQLTAGNAHELAFKLDSPVLTAAMRRKNSHQLLFSGPEDVRLGNALNYVLNTQDGVVTGISGRYHHMTRSFGGRPVFHAYLHPHQNATTALWLMVMIDTGANCEVARNMPWNCIAKSGNGMFKVWVGNKLKAGGTQIVDEFSEIPTSGESMSLPTAIFMYQEMAARYHNHAAPGHEESLLLHEYLHHIHTLTEFTGRGWLADLLKNSVSLHSLNIKPSFLRPSVLMAKQHENGNNIAVARDIAQHATDKTTFGYTKKAPITLEYNLGMREFAERLQAVIIVSIDGAAEKLGLSAEDFKRILSDAHRTGLGVACLDSLAGVQATTIKGEPCDRLDACCDCKMRYVVATLENAVDLILFNRYLNRVEQEHHEKNPDAWEERWLPWRVFSDVAVSKMAIGETAKLFKEATALADLRESSYIPIPLF
ncbi:hypothetical protein [Duganella sp. S19_KUP01_CR8]|uniref:hypothetical protein n=1 Tax=Duganella sp. S19_KUP01_CR8 TaxID=3025502 RepID=UPI002FCD8519